MPDVGIIQAFTQLPIGLLDTALDANGPYGPGIHSLTTWTQVATVRNVSDTFGALFQVSGPIAPKLGLTPGYDDGGTVQTDIFSSRIVQVVQLFQTRSGVWVPMNVQNIFYLPYLVRWVEDQPGKIGLYVSPTWSVEIYYLITL